MVADKEIKLLPDIKV
uniref:Uncharacterized protein n=1 Tax=Anguilla anguilla TaxID=7936 RepID=A0A0E9QN66_ANGAN